MPTRAGIEKGKHATLMFLTTALAVVFRFWGSDMVVDIAGFEVGCSDASISSCVAHQAVYRFSFTLFAFFLILTAVGYFGLELPWLVKNPLFIVLGIVPFFMPNDFFSGYAEFARVASALFLVLQILILIEAAYQANDFFLARIGVDEPGAQERGEWKGLYLFVCLGSLALAYTGVALLYDEYGECSSGMGFTTVTVIVCTLALGFSVSTVCNKGLMTPAIVFVYAVYLCWQALSSHPEPKCNPAAADDGDAAILLGLVVTAASLTWTSWRTAGKAPDVFHLEKDSGVAGGARETELSDVLASDTTKAPAATSRGAQVVDPVLPWQFFAVMCLGGCYLAMLVTNWADTDGSSAAAGSFATGMESLWVKIISQWLTLALYVWTLAAPVLLPDRDFA